MKRQTEGRIDLGQVAAGSLADNCSLSLKAVLLNSAWAIECSVTSSLDPVRLGKVYQHSKTASREDHTSWATLSLILPAQLLEVLFIRAFISALAKLDSSMVCRYSAPCPARRGSRTRMISAPCCASGSLFRAWNTAMQHTWFGNEPMTAGL